MLGASKGYWYMQKRYVCTWRIIGIGKAVDVIWIPCLSLALAISAGFAFRGVVAGWRRSWLAFGSGWVAKGSARGSEEILWTFGTYWWVSMCLLISSERLEGDVGRVGTCNASRGSTNCLVRLWRKIPVHASYWCCFTLQAPNRLHAQTITNMWI